MPPVEPPDHQALVGVLHSLKVLSTIKENDKVTTRKGVYINRCDNGLSGLLRWFWSENRSSNLDAIDAILQRGLRVCQDLLNQRQELMKEGVDPDAEQENDGKEEGEEEEEGKEPHQKREIRILENTQLVKRFQKELTGALGGVRNLTVTYAYDAHSVAKISLIGDFVSDELERIDVAFRRLTPRTA